MVSQAPADDARELEERYRSRRGDNNSQNIALILDLIPRIVE